MKAINVSIFEDKAIGNCSNNGISANYNEILLIHPRGNIDIDENNPPPNLCKVVEKKYSFTTYKYIEPVARPDGFGWMFGGALVFSSDARYAELVGNYPLKLHDRQETREQYLSYD